MQWSLFLLILMGQCSFFTCLLSKYHFVEEEKTWQDAQTYCRDNFTDLATVSDMSDMKRLLRSTANPKEAWIGLSQEKGSSRRFHWSLPGVEYHHNNSWWAEGSLKENHKNTNCVLIHDNKLNDSHCAPNQSFICYDEMQQSNQRFHFIEEKLNWLKAQSYCRTNHTDLVSRFSQLSDFLMETEDQKDVKLWIGLFRDTWRWSDNRNFSFRDWNLEFEQGGNDECAMTVPSRSGKWDRADCKKLKPFFCYEDNVILIKEKKTWVEALDHCREKYNDLVSVTTLLEQIWIQQRAKEASTDFVWVGLRYTCTLDFWFWVSDEVVHYKNWASEGHGDDCDMSGAMERGGEHKWFKKMDDKKFNFMCSKW